MTAAQEPDRPDPDGPDPAVPSHGSQTAPVPEARRVPPARKVALLAGIAVTVVLLDVVTKVIAVAQLTPGESPSILGGLVYFSLIRNPGAAFSMATGMTWVLALIAIAVVVVIIRMAPRLRSTPWAVSLGLVLGGALGNLLDRIFRTPGFLQGHVVDFVSVFGPNGEYFPIFNVADSAITVGGIGLVVTALLGIDYDGTNMRDRRRAEKAPRPEPGGA